MNFDAHHIHAQNHYVKDSILDTYCHGGKSRTRFPFQVETRPVTGPSGKGTNQEMNLMKGEARSPLRSRAAKEQTRVCENRKQQN